jgi:hypothetical protein
MIRGVRRRFARELGPWSSFGRMACASRAPGASFLGATGVIDQRRYEDALSSPTVFRTVLWTLMFGYPISFVVLYERGVGVAHRLSRWRALATGAIAFVAYQLVFDIFNR